MSDQAAEKASAPAAPAKAGGGGAAGWLPLIIVLVAMPGLAFVSTKFIIVPQVQKAVGAAATVGAGGDHAAPAAAASHGAPSGGGSSHGAASGGGGHGSEGGSEGFDIDINKIVVNVAGTMGTRYLLTSLKLEGQSTEFPAYVEKNRAKLMDVALSTLRGKTIADIERPGSQNQVRTELMTVFNDILTLHPIREMYITEFAIQ